MCDATVLTRPLFHPSVFLFSVTLSRSLIHVLCVYVFRTTVRICLCVLGVPPFFWTSFSILFKPFPCPSKAFQLTGHLEASASWVPLLGGPFNTCRYRGPPDFIHPPLCARRGLQANRKGSKDTFWCVSSFLSGRVATNRLVTTGD